MMLLRILLIGCLAGMIALLYGWWDTNRFSLRRVTIELDRLPEAFDGFTILQVSDLHNRAYGRDGLDLERKIEKLSFDIIAVTGDILDRHLPKQRENGFIFLQSAARLAPVYFVQGNHEWIIGDWKRTRADLIQQGARVLDNETISLERAGSRLTIAGCMEEADPETLRRLVSEEACSILLAHHPERMNAYARAGVDLVLSGHAHGGQIRLFGRGLYSPNQGIFPKYTSGVYTQGNTKLYVSRGAGNHSFLPPRIFNRPEIDLIILKAPSR